jgi:CRISPR-associated endoribonuclease Cas6
MRLCCQFEAESVPLPYQMMFVSLIKEILKNASEEYFNQLYYYDHDKRNKQSKNFCFAVFLKNFEFKDDHFVLKEGLDLNISSPDKLFIGNFFNGLLKTKSFEYKNYSIKLKKFFLLPEKNIVEEKVTFKTMSPIYLTDKRNRPLTPYDENFTKEYNYLADMILTNYRGVGLLRSVEFTPIQMKKVVVKEEIREFQKNTGKEYLFLESYQGTFSLEGDVYDLRDIYALGVSLRRSQGFGMIEVI